MGKDRGIFPLPRSVDEPCSPHISCICSTICMFAQVIYIFEVKLNTYVNLGVNGIFHNAHTPSEPVQKPGSVFPNRDSGSYLFSHFKRLASESRWFPPRNSKPALPKFYLLLSFFSFSLSNFLPLFPAQVHYFTSSRSNYSTAYLHVPAPTVW